MLFDSGATLGLCYDEEALEVVLCSFEQTTSFIITQYGQEMLEQRVFMRAAEIETRYHITVPPVVANNPTYHYYYSAALLRIVVAFDHITRLTSDLRWHYDTDTLVQNCVFNLTLFADTHQELFVMCDAMGAIYEDDWLSTPTSQTITVNLPPLPVNATAAEWRARKELQNKALLSDAVYFSPLERAYPHPLRAVCAGELINFGSSLVQSNLWMAVREVSLSDTARCLHALLGKAGPHKCLKRNLDIMISQELGAQPVLVPVLFNLLETTQLGNYPGARYRPLWRARLCIRRSFHWEKFELNTWCAACHKGVRSTCPKCPKKDDISAEATSIDGKKSTALHSEHLCDVCQFLRSNKYLVFFAIKEFYIYSIREQGLINAMLEQESGWIEHCALLLHALDDVRRILSSAFADKDNTNPEVVRRALWRASRHMVLMHDCNKPTMRRLYKSPYMFEQMLSKMHRYHRKEIVVWQWTGCQQPEDFLMAPLLRDRGDANAFPTNHGVSATARFYACDERLPHLGGKRWCDVYTLENVNRVAQFCVRNLGGDLVPSMLFTVGMSPHASELLEKLHFNSTVRDLPDNKLMKECRNIGSKHMTDFHLLHHFLRMLKRHHAVRSFPLDLTQTRLQSRALRLRHKIDPWGVLPRDTHHVAVCRNDEQVFASVVEAADFNAESDDAMAKDGSALTLDATIFARGVTSAFFDHDQGALVCPRDAKSANAKKWRKSDQQRAVWFSASGTEDSLPLRVSNALSIRTSLENKRECARGPLEYHSLLGSVLCVGNRALTLCVKCGCVCTWQDTCMTTWGMTCGREIRFAERERYSALQQFATLQTATLRNRDDNGVFDVRETILLAPQSSAKRDPRADLFDRVTTPVFDQARGYEHLLFINAMNSAPRSLVDKSDKMMKDDITYLLDETSQPSERRQLSVTRSRASRPRTSRKQKAIATDDVPEAEEGDGGPTPDLVGSTSCNCKEECECDAVDEVFRAPDAPVNSDETIIPMKLGERQKRAGVPYAERHRVQPHNYSDNEWQALNDEQKLFAWTNEGRVFREQYLALKQKPSEISASPLAELMFIENERQARLRADGFFDKEMARMRAIDECAASEGRSRRSLCMDNFSDEQIVEMRQMFIEAGLLEVRHDICCAFCRIVCDPRGQFKRISVVNLDGMLVNPLTGKPIEERGVVQIWLCNNEWKHVERMMRDKELPLASDLFIQINSKRARAREQALRHGGGGTQGQVK
jgi:hypothetical protein